MTERSERFERGAARLAEMGGDIANIVEPLADVAPDLARLVGEFAFGDLYTRPGLDLPQRQLVTIGALVALGGTERQLKSSPSAGSCRSSSGRGFFRVNTPRCAGSPLHFPTQ